MTANHISKKISIILPVFNEERYIIKCLTEISKLHINKEVIVVNDCSTDNTLHLLNQNKILFDKLISLDRNQGKGEAFKRGLDLAIGDYVIIQDADLEYNPADILNIYNTLCEKNDFAVYGSRFLNQKNSFTNNLRYHANSLLTKISNYLNKQQLTDCHTCYKAMRRDIFNELNIVSKGFELCIEINTKLAKKKIKIIELSVRYNGRNYYEGKKISYLDGLKAIYYLFKYRFQK